MRKMLSETHTGKSPTFEDENKVITEFVKIKCEAYQIAILDVVAGSGINLG